MTIYTPKQIADAINTSRSQTNWRDAEAVTDLAAQHLAGLEAEDDALERARHIVRRTMAVT